MNNTATQSLFNLTKYETNLDQIDQIKLIVKDIECLKMPTLLINVTKDNQTDQIDHDEQVDIPNFIDDLPANDEPVITTVPDNFNRGPNFKAYDEIKRYESISYFDIYHS